MNNGVLHITTHGGKLEGIPSINTTTKSNRFCRKMADVPGSVCAKCYAGRLESFRRGITAALQRNTEALTTKLLHSSCLPWFPDGWLVRFHSFGELHNEIHLRNFYAIAMKNPRAHFALWTKRKRLVHIAGPAPDNLVLIYSEPMLDPEEPVAVPKGFDYTYAVRTTGEPCGDACLTCQLCYHKPLDGRPRVIWQKLH